MDNKKILTIVSTAFVTSTFVIFPSLAISQIVGNRNNLINSSHLIAQRCNQFLGEAVTGSSIVLDTCSITYVSSRAVNFVYYLGGERINAQANCRANTWTTFPERAVHRPRSGATQSMLDIVCN